MAGTRTIALANLAKANRRRAAALHHPQTVKELVAWLDAHPGLQVCYVKADPANGIDQSFLRIYPQPRRTT